MIGKLLIRLGLDTDPLNKQLGRAERRLGRAGGRLSRLGSDLSMGVSLPIIGIGGAAIKAAADFEKLELALVSQMGTTKAAREEMAKLREVAENPGLEFEQAIKGSVRLQAVEFSAGLARRSLAAFGNALAAAGKDGTDLDGVTLALSQIASKGKVSAEEINQLAERVPQIRMAMKDAFGTADTEAIQGLQKAGLTTEQFVVGVVEQLEKIPPVAGGISNSFVNFQTAVKLSMAEIGRAIDETVDVEAVMAKVTNAIAGAVRWFGDLDSGTKKMIVTTAALVAAVGPVAKVIGSAKLVVSALSGVMIVANKATRLLTIGQAALNAVMKANPVGILITAITTLTLAFTAAYKKNAKFRAAMDGLRNVAREVLRVVGEAVRGFANAFALMKTGQIKKAATAFKEAMLKSNPVSLAITQGKRLGEAYRDGYRESIEKGIEDEPIEEPITYNPDQYTQETTETQKAIQDLVNAKPVIMDIQTRVKQDRKAARNKGEFYGSGFDANAEEINIVTNAIEEMLNNGVDPSSQAIQGLVNDFHELRAAGSMGVAPMIQSLDLIPTKIDSITEKNDVLQTSTIATSNTMSLMAEQMTLATQNAMIFGDAMSLNAEKINILKSTIQTLIEDGFDPMGPKIQNLKAEMDELQFAQDVAGMFEQMGQSMMNSAKQGELSLKSLAVTAIQAAGAFVQAKLMEAVAAAVADSFKKTGMFGLVIGAGVAAATGALFNGLMNKFTSAIPMANGAILHGPTNVLAGEYSGARNNPEVIAPLNKLKTMINPGGGSVHVTGTIRAEGNELLTVIENSERTRNRTRGY